MYLLMKNRKQDFSTVFMSVKDSIQLNTKLDSIYSHHNKASNHIAEVNIFFL